MRRILFAVALSFLSTAGMASEEVLKASKYKEGRQYFELIGKTFVAKKDNTYFFNKKHFNYHGNPAYSGSILKVFLKSPNPKDCRKDVCFRKHLHSDSTFVVTAIVAPSAKAPGDNCNTNAFFCYLRVGFEDGDTGYISVHDFVSASGPMDAVAMNTPALLQITPKIPDQRWRSEKAYFDKHFKKLGVVEGFGSEDVLRSSWGKPLTKTKSSFKGHDFEHWAYENGLLTFEDGALVQITTLE